MVERKQYLQELKQWKDDDVIKVVTGLRRCGKSTLLAQFQNWLLENGIENEQIISINFEELEICWIIKNSMLTSRSDLLKAK